MSTFDDIRATRLGYSDFRTRRVNLGDHVPDTQLQELVDRLEAVATITREKQAEVDRLNIEIANSVDEEPAKLAAMIWRGETTEAELAERTEAVADLVSRRDHALREIANLGAARELGVNEIATTLTERGPAVAADAVKAARGLRGKLALAIRGLSETAQRHDDLLGIVHLVVARGAGSNELTVRHSPDGPRIELSLAIEHARNALVRLDDELSAVEAAVTPLKRRKRAQAAGEPAPAPSDADDVPDLSDGPDDSDGDDDA